MFYFAHPFGGIATPSSTSYSINPYAGMPTAECRTSQSKCAHRTTRTTPNQAHQQHLNDFTPWPRQTWQSRDVLSPLIQALQRQIGKFWICVCVCLCSFNLKCNQTPLNFAGKIMYGMFSTIHELLLTLVWPMLLIDPQKLKIYSNENTIIAYFTWMLFGLSAFA